MDFHLTGQPCDEDAVTAPNPGFTVSDEFTLILPGGRRVRLDPAAVTLEFDEDGSLASYTLRLPDGPETT